MSEHVVPASALDGLALLCHRFLRPSDVRVEPDGTWVFIFTPGLSPAETTRFNRLVRVASSPVQVTPDEWEALVPVIVSIRTHRTRTNAEWTSMTAAQRDSALIDWNRNLTDVLRAMLRD